MNRFIAALAFLSVCVATNEEIDYDFLCDSPVDPNTLYDLQNFPAGGRVTKNVNILQTSDKNFDIKFTGSFEKSNRSDARQVYPVHTMQQMMDIMDAAINLNMKIILPNKVDLKFRQKPDTEIGESYIVMANYKNGAIIWATPSPTREIYVKEHPGGVTLTTKHLESGHVITENLENYLLNHISVDSKTVEIEGLQSLNADKPVAVTAPLRNC